MMILTAIGFHSVAVGVKTVHGQKIHNYTWGETIHKTIKKHRTHKIEIKT